jgi:hypothetical protein
MDKSSYEILYSRSLVKRCHDLLYDYRYGLTVCTSSVDDLIGEARSYLAVSKPDQPTSEER